MFTKSLEFGVPPSENCFCCDAVDDMVSTTALVQTTDLVFSYSLSFLIAKVPVRPILLHYRTRTRFDKIKIIFCVKQKDFYERKTVFCKHPSLLSEDPAFMGFFIGCFQLFQVIDQSIKVAERVIQVKIPFMAISIDSCDVTTPTSSIRIQNLEDQGGRVTDCECTCSPK